MPRLHRGSPLPASAPGSLFQPCHDCTGTGSCPHLHRDWAHPCHICTGTGLTPTTSATSASGLGAPLPHLHWDRPFTQFDPQKRIAHYYALLNAAVPSCIPCSCSVLPATSATGLGSLPPHLPHLHRDWAHPHPIRLGLGSPHPHLHRDWAHPHHSCTGPGRGAVRSGATCSASSQRIRKTV
jgi:hypothetical protein